MIDMSDMSLPRFLLGLVRRTPKYSDGAAKNFSDLTNNMSIAQSLARGRREMLLVKSLKVFGKTRFKIILSPLFAYF